MIYIKLHFTDEGSIIAICDESLIGKELEDGEIYIDLNNYSDFYIGDLVDPLNYKKSFEINDLNSANIVGEESVKFAVEKGLILEDNIKYVDKVPYAHTYVIKTNKK